MFVAELLQRQKSPFFSSELLHSKKIQSMLILAFEENSTASLNCTFWILQLCGPAATEKDQDGLYL